VERFEVVGSTVFSSETFAKATAPFTRRPLSFAELLQARSAVAQLYIDQGYITSGALIRPQTLRGGVVTIEVIEGSLVAINVTGTSRLKVGYIRDRIRRATNKPLNRDRLLEALQLLQLNPLIENLSADLSSGTRPGTSLLEVQITEAKTFRPQISLNNNRSPSVGSFQRGAQLNEANLLGLGDSLRVAYFNTDGSNEVNASYTVPLNSRDGTLSLNYGRSSSDIIEEPFTFLDIQSASRYYDLSFRQPLVQTPTQEFALGLTASRRESDASFLEDPGLGGRTGFPSPGADDQGRTRIAALRLFQDWTRRGTREVFAARSEFSLGLDVLNATVNQDAPDSRFFAWRGQGQWVHLLAPETLLLLRTDIQVSTTSLVPIEQFGLGGQESVRGYRQDLVLSDSGAFASTEVRLPIYRAPRQQGVLQLAPFVDFGTVWGSSDETNLGRDTPNTLVSVGLGLRLQWADRLIARLDWGIPLVSVTSGGDSWQESGLYFSVLYNPL
jgi:hemolysin activation/secretion protein